MGFAARFCVLTLIDNQCGGAEFFEVNGIRGDALCFEVLIMCFDKYPGPANVIVSAGPDCVFQLAQVNISFIIAAFDVVLDLIVKSMNIHSLMAAAPFDHFVPERMYPVTPAAVNPRYRSFGIRLTQVVQHTDKRREPYTAADEYEWRIFAGIQYKITRRRSQLHHITFCYCMV